MFSKYLALVSLIATPSIALAVTPRNFKELVENVFVPIIQSATVVVMSLSLLYFFWGLVKFVFNQSSENAKKEGKTIMTWGLLALIVSFSLTGILNFLMGNIQLGSDSDQTFRRSDIEVTNSTTGRTTTFDGGI